MVTPKKPKLTPAQLDMLLLASRKTTRWKKIRKRFGAGWGNTLRSLVHLGLLEPWPTRPVLTRLGSKWLAALATTPTRSST